ERRREVEQRQRLEQKLKTSLTAAAVAHEIQQPLAAILLKCRLAAHDLAAIPPADATTVLQQRLSSLTADAELVVTTVERMRLLLRNVETIHSCVDLSAILRSALVVMRSEIETQQVQLSEAGLEQPSKLQGDSAQLQMAVVNLLRNALQAMENQRPSTRRIRVELQHQPGEVNVVVADSGPGFPPDHRCDTSWELLKSSKATGMGLGLFLAQTAAANHRGRLRIGRSATLGGAEVVLELPLNVS
ncbi:MAG: ATP-binding protein, partial [Prochlorococcaceae cyanobacterium]